MKIKLYRYTKRFNSTAHPDSDDTNYVEHTGELKDKTSLTTPAVKFKFTDSTTTFNEGLASPIRYNYCWINVFKRWYWIRDWVWESPFWVAYMEEDVLATWKTSIGETTQYILRASDVSISTTTDSSTGVTVGDVIDMQYTATAKEYITSNSESNPMSISNYTLPSARVLSILSGNGYDDCGIKRGTLTLLGATNLVSALYGTTTDIYGITTSDLEDSGLTESVLKSLFNPISYIRSYMAFPIGLSSVTGTEVDLNLGWWEAPDVTIKPLQQNYYDLDTITLTVPKHPQADTRGSYLNSSPYATYTLQVPPFGTYTIPADYLWGISSISIKIRLDLITGTGYFRATANSNIIASGSTQIGIELGLGQVTQNVLGAAVAGTNAQYTWSSGLISAQAGGVNAVQSAFYGNIAGAVSGAASALTSINSAYAAKESYIADAAQKGAPEVSVSGSPSGSAAIFDSIRITGRFKYIVNKDTADLGLPYCAPDTINNHSGYLLVEDADLSSMSKEVTGASDTITIHANADEMLAIKNFLEGGFFYN